MSEYELDQDNDVVGYISIKDYAYEESNPLHFGYFEEEEGEGESDKEIDVGESEGDLRLNNRESVLLPDEYVVNRKAIAMYAFVPENDNELELNEGDIVYISYKHGQGWLVAENHDRSKTGLVPEEYVQLIDEKDSEEGDEPEHARPFYLTQMITQSMCKSPEEDEWEDIEEDEEEDEHIPVQEQSEQKDPELKQFPGQEEQRDLLRMPAAGQGLQRLRKKSNARDYEMKFNLPNADEKMVCNGTSHDSNDDRSDVGNLAQDINDKLEL